MKLQISDDLSLPPDAITRTFGILAIRGAGKSNAGAVMAEEMFAAGLPFVVVDPFGAWWGLRSTGDGKGPGLSIPIFGGKRGDVPLEATGGIVVADFVVDQRISCVLDLANLSKNDRTRFLTDFAERLFKRNEEPLHLFLEEADDYIPQKPRENQKTLLGAWEDIVRRGRGRGLGLTMITQRSAVINKDVLTQVENLLVLRTTSPQDIKAIEGWIKYHGQSQEILSSLSGLDDGEAWLWSPQWLKIMRRTKIRRRSTYDSGATPKMLKARPAAAMADVDLAVISERMQATIQKAQAEDPRELKRKITELQRQLKQQKPNPASVEVKTERIEVPVIQAAQIAQLEKISGTIGTIADKMTDATAQLTSAVKEIASAIGKIHSNGHRPAPRAPASPLKLKPEKEWPKPSADHALPEGERRVLTAIAQYEDGLERDQMSVLTGFKRSTRDAYVHRLKGKCYVYLDGPRVIATPEGIDALGPDFEPLPTGRELQQYWLDKLPEGEAATLEILIDAYPQSIERERLSEKTGYKRSTRDAYIQRLKSRRIVEIADRGELRASANLFD